MTISVQQIFIVATSTTIVGLVTCTHRYKQYGICIGVDLAGILRGTHGEHRRWVGAEWGGVWEGRPLSSQLGGLGSGERCELPQRGPAENGFWRILKATERSFLYLFDKNLRGQFALASPSPNSGDLSPASPRDLRPWAFGSSMLS